MQPRLDLLLAAGWAFGAVLGLRLPEVAPGWACGLAVALGLSVLYWRPRWRLVAGLLIGAGWAVLVAGSVMQSRLPADLQGQDLQLEGRVVGLPQQRPGQLRFQFRVEAAEAEATVLVGKTVRLSWYGSQVIPEPGSRWRLPVRLRRPRGTLNPGGFDFERSMLEKRIAATGYVRDGPDRALLRPGAGVDALRARVAAAIDRAVAGPGARFVRALAVGDTRGLDGADWQVLRATGTAHLVAISGLHVGMAAGFGLLLVRGLYFLLPGLGLRVPLPQAGALAALLAALAYAWLAGFSLPTLRAVLMVAAALLAVLLRRAFVPAQAFALALLVVLAIDPLAVLNAGFWLSFVGVAWLLWCMPGRAGVRSWWRTLLSVQGITALGLLPLTVWFFGQASIAGPLCNLVAVPWVSLLVVPLALGGAALETPIAGAGELPFRLAAWLMDTLWRWMEPVASLHGALVYLPEASLAAFVLALAGVFWLLLPRGIPGKRLALFLFAPLLFPNVPPAPADGIDLTLLDVGQGLSVLVQTRSQAMLVDAGAAFPGGFDMGEAAVVPALRALGVGRLDSLVTSHDDNDHTGGTQAVVRAYAPERVLAMRATLRPGEAACRSATTWLMDGVTVRVLHPPEHFPYLGNDSSCVLRLDVDGVGLLLLPGDIGRIVEARLVREQADGLRARVLVVPHHGSLTSSSEGFIEAVDPALALIGSGHRNRFGLPRAEVLERYQAREIPILDTADQGAVRLRVDADGVRVLRTERAARRRIWRE